MHTEIKSLDLYMYMGRTIYVTMLVLMCIFPRLRNLSNVSFYLRNLASNHNVVV